MVLDFKFKVLILKIFFFFKKVFLKIVKIVKIKNCQVFPQILTMKEKVTTIEIEL